MADKFFRKRTRDRSFKRESLIRSKRAIWEPEDVNETDELLCTPLHDAVSRGWLEAAVTLIRRGADVNAPNRWGDTPLALAIRAGYESCVTLLLRAGADPKLCNRFGMDAATVAQATIFESSPEKRKTLDRIHRLLQPRGTLAA